jgi:hypothetical protein
VIVTWLLLVDAGAVGDASFGTTVSVALPESTKMQGKVAPTGHDVACLLRTSDDTGPEVVAVAPESELITSKTGARPVRTTSPHEAVAVTTSVSDASPITLRIDISFMLIGS